MVIRSTMKPRWFVLFAAELAMSVPLVVKGLRWATGRVAEPNAPPPPHPATWRRLYRKNRLVVEAWAKGFGLVRDSPIAMELRSGAAGRLVAFPPSREELFDLFRWAYSGVAPEGPHPLVHSPEGQFFIRVWVPCLVLYREAPGRLLRRARAGDDDAFEDLLRLDKSVLSDPVLWRRWHSALNDAKRARRQRFRDAMGGLPQKRFDAKTVRVAFAGLLSQVAKREGCPMTGPEIREWFGMFQFDMLTEQDMPGGEALTKAIQRHSNWPFRSRRKRGTGQ